MAIMTPLYRRTRAFDYLILALVGATLAAILYPVFAMRRNRSRQTAVYDAYGKPVPHARLTFADANGRIAYTVETDKGGRSYDRKVSSLAPQVVGEYAFQRANRNTGWTGYVFAKRGAQVFHFHDGNGAPMPELSVMLDMSFRRADRGYYARRIGDDYPRTDFAADASGTLTLPGIGLAQRFEPRMNDYERFAVRSVAVRPSDTRIDYDVTVDRVAMITGIVVDASGNPVSGRRIEAHIYPAPKDANDWSPATGTHASGRFQIGGLASGTYVLRVNHVSPKIPAGSDAAPLVSVGAGKTWDVRVTIP